MTEQFDNIDLDLARKLDQGMKTGNAVELPFPVVYIWAMNGQVSYKAQGGALYHGGWACKVEDMQACADQSGLTIPADWKQVTIATRDAKEFEAYTSRVAMVAPIGQRVSWILDNKRAPEYVEGARHHVQVLAYMAEIKETEEGKKLQPWGTVVLSAKGYQARNLQDAFSFWKRATGSLRGKASPWMFYLSLGTFGKERVQVNVGKQGAQSPITPITCGMPEKVDRDFLVRRYVGSDMLAVMLDCLEQGADWLNAWKESSLDPSTSQEPGMPPDNFPEDIPF